MEKTGRWFVAVKRDRSKEFELPKMGYREEMVDGRESGIKCYTEGYG